MKTKLKVLTGLVLLIFLTTSLTLVALAETSDKDENLFNPQEVGLAPDGIGLLATTFNVTSTTDAGDANLGDGICASAANECTLRAAIEEANAFAGPDTINLQATTYVLTQASHIEISSVLTLTGVSSASTTIDGNANARVFRILSGGNATVSGVTITNGSDTKGGGIWIFHGTLNLLNSTISNNTAVNNGGGGIFNEEGTLTVDSSTITNNTAKGGGGIFNESGTVTINNTIISENTSDPQAPTFGLGIGVGGGIANSAKNADATLTINQSTIISNTAKGTGGGGINNSASMTNKTATVTLNQSIVSGNDANPTAVTFETGFGGGIRNGFADPANGNTTAILIVNNSIISGNEAVNGAGIGSGTTSVTPTLTLKTTLNNSTVSGNTTTYQNNKTLEGSGGGLVNVNGILSLVNSTVSGNSATGTDTTGGQGGGIFSGDLGRATTLWLTNTTISSNTAQISAKGDGVANAQTTSTATSNFKNSIIAGGCLNNGTLNSQGYNLDDDNSCSLTATGDITNTNPLLGPLQDNSTTPPAPLPHTETHALLENSPALGAGDQTVCAAAPISNLDQRGVTRPATDPACDIGSFESSLKAPSTGGGTDVYLPIVIKG